MKNLINRASIGAKKTNYIFKARWLQGAASANESKKMQVNPRITPFRFACTLDSLACRLRVLPSRGLRMAAMLCMLLTLSIGNAWGATVTIDSNNIGTFGWNTTQGSQSGSAGGITITSDNGARNSTTQVRFYSGGTHTFTSSVGNITKVEFTCTASGTSNYGPGKMSLASGSAGSYSYSGTVGTWTGNAASFTLSGGQSRCTSIVITYTAAGATITTDASSMTTLTYSNGSPVAQSFSIGGSGLTSTVTVTAPANYEVCKTSGGTYTSSITFTHTEVNAADKTVYIRLQSGLSAGNIASSNVTVASSGASTQNVAVTGSVPYTITWMANGSTHATTYVAVGSTLALPATDPVPNSCGCTGKYFYGWYGAGSSYSHASAAPTIAAAGSAVSADKTYYAVFADRSGSGAVTWDKVTSAPSDWSGDYVIVESSSANAMISDFHSGTSGEFKSASVTINAAGTQITSTPTDKMIWTFAKNGSNAQYSLRNKSTGTYAQITGTSSTNAALNASAVWFTIESTGTSGVWDVASVTNSARCFAWYATNSSFRTYAKSTNNTGRLFKKSGDGYTWSNYATTCCSAPATALSITSGASVTLGNTLSLTSTGGNGGSVTWSVVNGTGTATVAGSTLTPATVGTVTVKAHQEATGGYCEQDAELEVTIVSSTVNVTGVTVDPTSKTIVVGETFTITPTIAPANATDKTIKSWTSSASGKASVTSAGVVTGVAAGTANITCTTNDGSKTATCAVTVYSATVTSIVDESGTSISGSGVSASISARNLTASEGTTNYKFKNWEFVGSSNGLSISSTTSLSTTLTGTPTGNVSLKAVFYKPVTIAWKVGTDDAAAGSQTLNAKRGTEWKDLTLPSAPADNTLSACSNKFMGWTNGDELEGTGNSAPAVCLKSFSGVTTAIESPLTFRAVFATESAGGEAVNTVLFSEDFSGYSADNVPSGSVDNDHTGTTVYNGGSVTYSCTNGTKTSGSTAGGTTAVKNEALAEGTAPEIMVGKKGSGDGAVGGTFVISGIPNGGASELTVSYKQNANGLSATASGTSYSGSKTASTKAEQSFDVTVGSGTMTLTFQATTTSNVRLDNIEVKVKTRGVTYSNYVTKCCTQHTITLAGSGSVTGGTFTSDPTSACEDVEVHLSATPDESHEFGSWTITNTSTGDDVTDDVTLVDNDFLMPDYGVTVTPTFNALTAYTVTWIVDGTTWSGKGGSTVVYQGRRISTLPTAPDYEDFCGDVFIGWTTVANYVYGSSPLYTKASDFPTASADQIFYAVFADFNE